MENPQWLPWRVHRAERTKLGLRIEPWMFDKDETAERAEYEATKKRALDAYVPKRDTLGSQTCHTESGRRDKR